MKNFHFHKKFCGMNNKLWKLICNFSKISTSLGMHSILVFCMEFWSNIWFLRTIQNITNLQYECVLNKSEVENKSISSTSFLKTEDYPPVNFAYQFSFSSLNFRKIKKNLFFDYLAYYCILRIMNYQNKCNVSK